MSEPELLRISVAEARALLDEGYRYLDVRTEIEFAAGHPSGAYNVPFLHAGPGGMVPNPEYLSVVERTFARDDKIIVGCQSGKRSVPAARALLAAGYRHVVELRQGYGGLPGPFGQVAEPGWAAAGLPVAIGEDAGSYQALRAAQPDPRDSEDGPAPR